MQSEPADFWRRNATICITRCITSAVKASRYNKSHNNMCRRNQSLLINWPQGKMVTSASTGARAIRPMLELVNALES